MYVFHHFTCIFAHFLPLRKNLQETTDKGLGTFQSKFLNILQILQRSNASFPLQPAHDGIVVAGFDTLVDEAVIRLKVVRTHDVVDAEIEAFGTEREA